MYQLLAYLKFLATSKNQHGIHSPFVYSLVTKCIYDKTPFHSYKTIEAYRKSLVKNDKYIEVNDLGAGSKVSNSKMRKISSIAKSVSSSLNQAKFLYRLTQYFHAQNVLELGTSLGMGTFAIACGTETGHITTIEGCPQLSKFALRQLQKFNINNVTVLNGPFEAVIKRLDIKKLDLVFFDGHHKMIATQTYFELLLPKIHNNTVFVFDDIYWSREMTATWKFIKTHPRVTVTVDCFHKGIVFFREEQVPQHFKIRM